MPRSSFPVDTTDDSLDIFGRPAGWMLYWGTGIVTILLLGILLFSAWVSYPDEVVTEVIITTNPPPVPVVNRTEGLVAEVFVEEGQEVPTNAPLLLLDNPARFSDIRLLEEQLSALTALDDPLDLSLLALPENLQLGELGRDYTRLLNLGTEIDYWLQRQQNGQRTRELAAQLKQVREQQANLVRQIAIQDSVVKLAEQRVVSLETLEAQKVPAASQLEISQAKDTYLRARRQGEEERNRLTASQSREAALRESLVALNEGVNDEIMNRWLAWRGQLRMLQQGLQVWKEKYLLRATAPGRVSFYTRAYPGLFLEAPAVVLGIVPTADEQQYFAEGQLPQAASGKIAVGTTAYLELAAYPAREFGQLPAEVAQVALIATAAGEGYRLLLNLPDGLRTTYGINLPVRQELSARAVLLSEERTLLGRLLHRLRSARYNR